MISFWQIIGLTILSVGMLFLIYAFHMTEGTQITYYAVIGGILFVIGGGLALLKVR